jgi:formylglycine-generating enzyme required for sulfatase activity
MIGGFGMKVMRPWIVFSSGSRFGFWVLLLWIFVAVAVWQAGTARSVTAQSTSKVNPKDGLTYEWIPPGTFQMGCSPGDSECTAPENQAHSVTITKGFWIGQTPVTQAAYTKVVGANPSYPTGDQLPVDTVSWDDAQAYCQGVDMRLPTEAEWEYAARGGSPAARYGPIDQIAWYGANSGGTTHPVGQKQANAYGLYDMLENVWEWTADWEEPYDAAGAVDPKGPKTGQDRVLRGGGWHDDASWVRVSYRGGIEPGNRNVNFGFRCAGN